MSGSDVVFDKSLIGHLLTYVFVLMTLRADCTMTSLLHITSRAAWAAADAEYSDPSLEAEGFIHCSTAAQVLTPANERFAHRADLLLLVINPELVPADIVFEDSYGSGSEYPHIYGTIPQAAVIAAVDFPCNADGTFTLPELPEA